jgi:hypothetical protein
MDKPMRCQCGRQRTVALDKHFRTALLCPTCDEVEHAEAVNASDQDALRTSPEMA